MTLIFGMRIDRSADSAWRREGARIFYRVFHALSGTELQQNSCDFRLLSRRAVDSINRIGERVRYNNGLFAWIGFPPSACRSKCSHAKRAKPRAGCR